MFQTHTQNFSTFDNSFGRSTRKNFFCNDCELLFAKNKRKKNTSLCCLMLAIKVGALSKKSHSVFFIVSFLFIGDWDIIVFRTIISISNMYVVLWKYILWLIIFKKKPTRKKLENYWWGVFCRTYVWNTYVSAILSIFQNKNKTWEKSNASAWKGILRWTRAERREHNNFAIQSF